MYYACMYIYSMNPASDVDLSKALTPESMIPILANPEVQAQLIPFLPEGEVLPKTEEELRSTVQSPQFKQVSAAKLSRDFQGVSWKFQCP